MEDDGDDVYLSKSSKKTKKLWDWLKTTDRAVNLGSSSVFGGCRETECSLV